MAMIICHECGKEISSRAKFCPHCGNPLDYLSSESEMEEPGTVGDNSDNYTTVTTSDNRDGNHKRKKIKKPIYKRWWFWVIVAVVVICIMVPSDDVNDTSEVGETASVSATFNETGENNVTADAFVEDVKTAIAGAIATDTESIDGVVLADRDLVVYVTIPQDGITSADLLAKSRTSSITEEILELDQYDSLWDTITVDFGDIGYIRNSKDNIQDDGYGRYFVQADGDFVLEGSLIYSDETGDDSEVTIPIETCISAIETVLAANYGDNYIVTLDDNVVTVGVWADGVALGAMAAVSGDADSLASWNSVMDAMVSLDNSIQGVLDDSGHSDIVALVNVVNDLNTDNTLASITAGMVIYDAVNGIDLFGVAGQ